MSTRFYLRNLTPTNDPGTTNLSTALPVGTFKDYALSPLALRTRIAAGGETDISGSSTATVAHTDEFFTSFSSEALPAQTITAQTWTVGLDLGQGNAGANSFLLPVVYTYREGSGVVDYIYDADTNLGNEWHISSGRGRVVTFSGGASTIIANDYLVFELWRGTAGQSSATAYTQKLWFDGNREVTEGSNAAAGSYIETPQDLDLAPAASIGMLGVGNIPA